MVMMMFKMCFKVSANSGQRFSAMQTNRRHLHYSFVG